MSDDTRDAKWIIAITKNNLHTNGAGGVTSAEYAFLIPVTPEREAEIKKDGIHLGDMLLSTDPLTFAAIKVADVLRFAIDKGYLTEGKAVGFTPGKEPQPELAADNDRIEREIKMLRRVAGEREET